jgi:colanic acid/amylovoran biosynthesis protein
MKNLVLKKTKSKSILVINVPGPLNRGSMAVVLSLVRNLRERLPSVNITLSTPHFKIDSDLYRNEPIEVRTHPFYEERGSFAATLLYSAMASFVALGRYVISRVLRKPSIVTNAYGDYDVIVDLDVDGLNDYYHGKYMVITCLVNTFFYKLLLRRREILVACSIGPLVSSISRFMAKLVLNHVDIITFRESFTENYIRKIDLTKPEMKVTADLAFSLAPANKDRVDQLFHDEGFPFDKAIIGVVPSQFASTHVFQMIKDPEVKYKRYIELMAKVINYIRKELGVFVLLIPHSVDPKHDDRLLCRQICEIVGNYENVKMIMGDYPADELKGIIGRCSILLSFLMHPTIQATSLSIPIVAPGYSQSTRVYGIIGKMMGQENCIVNFDRLNFDQLFSALTEKIDYVWKNRASIHEELVVRSSIVKKQSLSNFDYIERLLTETRSRGN